jgi:hypothetical protein
MADSDYRLWHLLLVGAGAAATLLAVLIALFKEDVRAWWRHPALQASIRLRPPDCHKVEIAFFDEAGQIRARAPCYYFRIWVENTGTVRAEQVQVYVSRLLRKHTQGHFEQIDTFIPMNLRWAMGPQPPERPEVFAAGISPKMGKHCDLGRIVEPKTYQRIRPTIPGVPPDATFMELDLEVQSLTNSHIIIPGTYRLEIVLAAANCLPINKPIELTITGKWFDSDAQMFADGVALKEII